MAGQHERHHLVAHLPLVHSFAVLVVECTDQVVEDVVAAGAPAAARFDHPVHDTIEPP